MATSQVQICNMALVMLREKSIASMTEATERAAACSSIYDMSLDSLLRLHNWNCCIKRAVLAPDAEAPAFEYTYQYSLPSDLIRIIDMDSVTDYRVEGRKILCNEGYLNIRYVFRNTEVTTYDSLFAETLAAYLAYKLTYAITASNTTREQQQKYFSEIFRQAKAVDALEEPGTQLGTFGLLDVRRGRA